jgi:hypothetical protein
MKLDVITNKITQAIKCFMLTRFNKVSTLIGLILLYLLINNRPELNSFVRWMFNDPLRKLIERIFENDHFIEAMVLGLVGLFGYIKKF